MDGRSTGPNANGYEGLSGEAARERRQVDGPNALPVARRPSVVVRFGSELVHFFALMLWVAGALAIVGRMPQLGIAIFAVVLLNAAFSFAQQARADRAAEHLRAMLPTRVVVRRDGRAVTVDAVDVVRGDRLLLEAGDRVPADAEVVAANALLLDTSLLTGESRPTSVDVGGLLYGGTFVVEGTAEAVVQAVGAATRLAGLARLTSATDKPPTPLTLGLQQVVRTVAVMALAAGSLFFAVSMLLGNGARDGFVFAIGVTVALVPEALLPTVTLSLAWGAEQMARRDVLVRHLEAVETLGSTTFICTDKTGTLTMNQMTAVAMWTPCASASVRGEGYGPVADVRVDGEKESIAAMALAAARCSTGSVAESDGVWLPHGDPMEAAVDALARRMGTDTDTDRCVRREVARFPFDPRRRRMSVVLPGEIVVKGAPDAVVPLCAHVDGVPEALEQMTRRGLRVLAVARRAATGSVGTVTEVEHGLTLLGLIGLHDPPRPDVHEAISACRRARVRIAMVTGDHPDTAAAIASEVGLRWPDDPVVLGADLPTDEAALGALLDHDGIVIARVEPEDKLRIARALRARGHVVAMTGDGVNDAPALHEADIGVAMGRSGTDVAREAADLVLLDDHFASIVAGIEQGRATFVNIRRFLTYHLTDNVAELTPFVVWMLSGGHFPLALGVMQILALDIGTDSLSALALGAEPPSRHLGEGPPVSGRLMNATVVRRAFGLLGPVIAVMSMLAFVSTLVADGWLPTDGWPRLTSTAAASGAAFMAVVFGQVANGWACRSSTMRPDQIGWFANRYLLMGKTVEVSFALAVLVITPIAREMGHALPNAAGWLVVLITPAVVLVVDALDKAVRARRRERG